MRSSEDPVVAAIRRENRFYVLVAFSASQTSGWHEATFADEKFTLFDQQWSFPTPGIPYSKIGVRFDPLRRESYNENHEDEIPLWPEPTSDYWAGLGYKGPWTDDLTDFDRARIAWGKQALRKRQRLAGYVQSIIDRQTIDGVAPSFDSQEFCLSPTSPREQSVVLFRRSPVLGRWLESLCGDSPNAEAAYESAFEALHDEYAMFCVLDKLFDLLIENDDEELNLAFQASLDAVLLDHRITRSGERRPWLANTKDYGMRLETVAIELNAPIENIKGLWRSGLEMHDLIDAGRYLGPQDFPIPYDQLNEVLEKVLIEGSIEESEKRTMELLQEAKDARQWSIPWGALVEIHLQPFQSVCIYEEDEEFSCYFLDEQDRYFHVAVGIGGNSPRIAMSRLIRTRSDDGEAVWNDDAEASLQLIAASIIRDFLVCEERETLFSSRPKRRRMQGRKTKTIIYLARVRYTNRSPTTDERESGCIATERSPHAVKGHFRKAQVASPAQQLLAQQYGIKLPEGFTFVRPHSRGGEPSDHERERIYRSRSASLAIFEQIDKAPSGSRPEWFEFEKDCARLLKARGMRVVHQSAHRGGDGGVDIYAIDPDEQSWVVQCKCWAIHRPVGPDVVRELEGAIKLADKGKEDKSRGLIITTSKLTQKAIDAAESLGFEWIDGDRFAQHLIKSG